MNLRPSFSVLAQRFGGIVDGLCALAAARMNRHGFGYSLGPPLLLLWSRLRRVQTRFAALAARAEQPSRHRAPRRVPDRGRAPAAPRPRLPGRHGWLLHMLPYEAACFGSQLQHLLADPDMPALIEAAPGMGRLLRPLCHMLAIPLPPALVLPKPAATDRPEPLPEPATEPAPDAPVWPPAETPHPSRAEAPEPTPSPVRWRHFMAPPRAMIPA